MILFIYREAFDNRVRVSLFLFLANKTSGAVPFFIILSPCLIFCKEYFLVLAYLICFVLVCALSAFFVTLRLKRLANLFSFDLPVNL